MSAYARIKIMNGVFGNFEIQAIVSAEREEYGADADGNRGVQIWVPGDIMEVEAYCNGREVWKRLKRELRDEIEEYIFENIDMGEYQR